MCGIAGVLRFTNEPLSIQVLKKMTDIIEHRGPDGEGHWINDRRNLGFGHRRLSIIDLSNHGSQPMHSDTERYTIVFNGEIYNYLELRKELQQQGHHFKSESDTEVLLKLYEVKKENCLEDLDGMFSFAIWDEKEQSLFAARDRFGEKPFHYSIDETTFVFASEIKQLWEYGIRKRVSKSRLGSFIACGELDDPNDVTATFYESVKRLDAGCFLTVNAGGKLKIERYWDIDLYAPRFKGSIEDASDYYRQLLTQSVQIRLRSDVAVGSSLSGGLDSSSIVMLIDSMKGNLQTQNTFSARFNNFGKDEGAYIDQVVKACKKNPQVSYVWPDEEYFSEVFKKVVYHQDEPFGSASIIAQYAVMELAKSKQVTVLLDGQGADEYLAGYPPYYTLYLNQLFYNRRRLYRREVKEYNALRQDLSTRHLSLEDKETIRMKVGRLRRFMLGGSMPVDDLALKRMLKADTISNGLKNLLRYADRNSMAHSREVRLPFLSHRLVEFAFTLPDNFMLQSGWTKFVLRKAMEPILPQSITWRVDKIGYEPPQLRWLGSPKIKKEIGLGYEKIRDMNLQETSDLDFMDWRVLVAGNYL